MDTWQQLYACLSVNHNFDNYIKIDDIKWQMWVQILTPHEHLIPGLVNDINNGELRRHLDIKRKAKIDVQDIKILIRAISHGNHLDNKTTNHAQLGHEPKGRGEYKNVYQEVLKRTKERNIDFTDYDLEKHQKYGRSYIDSLIGRKSHD